MKKQLNIQTAWCNPCRFFSERRWLPERFIFLIYLVESEDSVRGLPVQEALSVSDIARRTLMRTGITGRCLRRKESGSAMTQQKLRQEECRILISSVQDFLVRHSLLPENGEDLKMPEEPCSLKWPDWLQQNGLLIFSLKTYPDCCHMTKAGRFTQSSARFQNWGIMWSGKCLTARISESRSQERGCILSDILMEDVPEKYYLSQRQMERLLYKSLQEVREKESTAQGE